MNELQLTLSVDEVNLILEALGNQPYIKVSQLIGKIQQQASSQLQAAEDASAAGHTTTDGTTIESTE